MVELYLITNPDGHREAEHAAMVSLRGELGDSVFMVVVGEPGDGWWCDWCNAPLDVETGPILSVDDAALCTRCAREVLVDAPVVRIGSEVLLPVCRCEPCQSVAKVDDRRRRNTSSGEPLQ